MYLNTTKGPLCLNGPFQKIFLSARLLMAIPKKLWYCVLLSKRRNGGRKMLFCTGDTHGDFDRFKLRFFPERETMDRSDYVLICGDFGGLWSGTALDDMALDWLEALPFTMLFADGNHENYDLLFKLPVERWNGGKVHRLRPHVLHLMRGQVFNIDGHTFFTMGGASSHDVQDGILDRDDPEFDLKYYYLCREHARFRINHESWWKEELPSDEEYAEARENLARANHQVDFIITHCAPSSIEDIIGKSTYIHDRLTDFLDEVYHTVTFRHWYCGHYHMNKEINSKFTVLYKNVVQVI